MSAIRDKGDAAKVTERSLVLSLLDDKVLGEQEIHNSIHSLMVFGSDFVSINMHFTCFDLSVCLSLCFCLCLCVLLSQ